MAKQQKVNKNVVAAMTVVGMIVVVVGVVGLTLSNRTRDPKIFAERAAQMEKKNDLQQAVSFYKKAYSINKEVKYLNDAARCAYAIGAIGDMFNILIEANSADPTDQDVLVYTLDRLWELRRMGQAAPQRMRDTAEKLLKLNKDHVLALASQADALALLSTADPANKIKSDEALKRAVELDANDAHVVLLRVDREVTSRMAEIRAAGVTLSPSDQEARVKAIRADVIKMLQDALAKHPDESLLVMSLADAYINNQQYDEAGKLLEREVTRLESVDLRLALARYLVSEVDRRVKAADANKEKPDKEELGELIQKGLQNAGRASELDKAAFDAYTLRATLMKNEAERTGEWDQDKVAVERKQVEWFIKSIDDTVGIRSARAALDTNGRISVLTRGFDLAMNLVRDASKEEDRKIGMDAGRKFYDSCTRQFPDTYLTAMMKGQLSVIERDLNGAIAAYVKVEEKTAAPDVANTFAGQIYSRMAKEQLSFLYRETGEPGLALKETEAAIHAYQEAHLDLPRRLLLNRGDLLILLKRGPDAFDLAEQVLRASTRKEDKIDFMRLKARALALQGKEKEAQAVLTALEAEQGGSDSVLMDKARIAAFQQDWDEADRTLQMLLKNNPNSVEALRLLVQTYNASQRTDALVTVLNDLTQRVTDPSVQRLIRAYSVMSTIKDEEQRDAALLKLVNEIPDAADRAAELFAHYYSRNNFEQAGAALDELEKSRPNDKAVLIQQFTLALQRKQLTRAEQYVSKLAAINADSAHGSVFRGQFKYATGDYAASLLEFRNAERELPTDADLKVKLATALVSGPQPRFDDAIESLRQALEFNPRHFPARKLRCIILENLNRFQEAIPDLRVAADLNPNDKYIKEHKEVLDEELDPKVGIERREKLRASKPTDINNLARLAELYSRLKDAPKTEEIVKASMAIDPPSKLAALLTSRYYVNLCLLSETKDEQRAEYRKIVEGYFERLINSTERVGRVEIMMLEARFYEALNEFLEAERIYREADKYAESIAQADEKRSGRLMSINDQAEFYLKIRRYEDSTEAFKRMLTLIKPEDVDSIQACRLKIMKNTLMLRKYPEAEPLIDGFVKDFPTDIRGLMARAELQLAQGKLAEGRESLTRVLQQDAKQSWALLMRGKVNIDLKNYSEAVTDLNNCKLVAPNGFNNSHRIELARVYQITDKNELAESELKEVYASAPGPGEKSDAAMLLVKLYSSTNQLDKAQEWLNTMSAAQPDAPNWPYQLGKLLLNRREYSNAVPHLRKAVEMTSFKNAMVLADWLAALIRGNRAAEAAAAFEKLDPTVIDAQLRTMAAEAYLKLQKPAPARAQLDLAALDAARKGLEQLNAVVSRIGEIAASDTEPILNNLMTKVESEPLPAVRTQIALGRALVESSEPAKLAHGLEILDATLKQSPPHSTELAGALMARARGYELNNQVDKAVSLYEELIKQFENHAGALNNIAFLLADKLKKPDQAIPYAERARTLVPDNADVLDTLGWAYYQANQTQRAETTLTEAVRVDSKNLASWYHLGLTQEKTGDKAAARRSYQKGIDAAKSDGKLDSIWGKRLTEALGKLGG